MEPDGDASSPAGVTRGGVAEIQHTHILDAVVEAVAERGVAGTSVGLVCARAKVSRRAFYEHFDGLDECLLAVLDGALERAAPLVVDAFTETSSWRDGMRLALAEMLAFFDEDPALAQVCLVELSAAAPVVREHREGILAAFAALVLERIGSEVSHASPLAAEGTYASVVGIVGARLAAREPQPPLLELLGPLMGIIVGPFIEEAQVAGEVQRGNKLAREMLTQRSPAPHSPQPGDAGVHIPGMLLSARGERARMCLLYVVEQDGRGYTPSNRDVMVSIDIPHSGQASTLLGRLAGLGLLVKRSTGLGHPNAWSATAEGKQVARALTKR